MTDEEQQQAFLAALTADPTDSTCRLVYSDWLEERGRDSAAQEQRRMATARWVEAYEYMKDLASRAGTHYETYYEACMQSRKADERGEKFTQEMWDEASGERDVTVDDLINGATEYVDDSDGYGWSGFTQQGDEGLRNMWGDEIDPETFWEHWRAYTGREELPDGGSPFSCSC